MTAPAASSVAVADVAGLVPISEPAAVSAGIPIRRPSLRESAELLVAVIGVALAAPIAAVVHVPPLATACWRMIIASTLMSASALRRSQPRTTAIAEPHTWRGGHRWSALAGLLLALHFGLWIPSLVLTSVASSTALVVSQPLWALLVIRARGGSVAGTAWSGVFLAVTGMVVVTGLDPSTHARALAGDVLALFAGLAASLYTSASAQARRTGSTLTVVRISYPVAAAALLLVCLASGQRLFGYAPRDWLLLVVLGVVPQLISHTLLGRAAGSVSATVIGLALLFEVPGAALVAWVWIGQPLPGGLAPGMLLLMVGLLLVGRAMERRLPARPAARSHLR